MGEHTKNEVGAIVHDQGVTFRVWAPFASSVFVTGDFNNWSQTSTSLTKEDDGYWSANVSEANVGQEYKYVIHNGDKELLRNDPRARQLTPGGDNSVIADPHFEWEGDDFTMPAANELVIYEIHVGTFNRPDGATSGTFETAIAKLDYLAGIGINAVELMPSSSMWMGRGWGYAPNYIYAVEASYGGPNAFKQFVKEAHSRGIGVIMDVVYNHLSPEPNFDLWQFDGWSENDHGGIYFYNDWRGETPWGHSRLDYGRPQVRQFITHNVKMWLEDCHIDGLRVDSTHNMHSAAGNHDSGPSLPDGWLALQELTDTAKSIQPSAIIIAEDSTHNHDVTKPTEAGGAGFTAQWDTSFPYIIRDAINPIDDSNRNLSAVLGALTKHYNDDGFQRVIYSESHDIDANGRARLAEEIAPGNADSLFARRRACLAAALVLTSPSIPMLFQGQEFMEDGSFTSWEGLDWKKVDEFAGIVQLYTDLIALRRNLKQTTGGLLGQSFAILDQDESNKVIAYHRWNQGGPKDDVIIAANFSNLLHEDYKIKFPRQGSWKVRFNSDWNGYSEDFDNTPTPDVQVDGDAAGINLAPYSVIILSQD